MFWPKVADRSHRQWNTPWVCTIEKKFTGESLPFLPPFLPSLLHPSFIFPFFTVPLSAISQLLSSTVDLCLCWMSLSCNSHLLWQMLAVDSSLSLLKCIHLDNYSHGQMHTCTVNTGTHKHLTYTWPTYKTFKHQGCIRHGSADAQFYNEDYRY